MPHKWLLAWLNDKEMNFVKKSCFITKFLTNSGQISTFWPYEFGQNVEFGLKNDKNCNIFKWKTLWIPRDGIKYHSLRAMDIWNHKMQKNRAKLVKILSISEFKMFNLSRIGSKLGDETTFLYKIHLLIIQPCQKWLKGH